MKGVVTCEPENTHEVGGSNYLDYVLIGSDGVFDKLKNDQINGIVWEITTKAREVAFADFEVTPELMSLANEDALFMHCLPAHRGEEVSADVIDGPQSVVWEEAGNRLHAQKALLEFLLQ